MSRPEYRTYTSKYACFDCRKAFLIGRKRLVNASARNGSPPARPVDDGVVCPDCGAPMVRMGKFFKPPRRADKKQWEKVRALYRHGFIFSSYGSRPGYRPRTKREMPEFLEKMRRQRRMSPGERLLAKMEADSRPRSSKRKR